MKTERYTHSKIFLARYTCVEITLHNVFHFSFIALPLLVYEKKKIFWIPINFYNRIRIVLFKSHRIVLFKSIRNSKIHSKGNFTSKSN